MTTTARTALISATKLPELTGKNFSAESENRRF